MNKLLYILAVFMFLSCGQNNKKSNLQKLETNKENTEVRLDEKSKIIRDAQAYLANSKDHLENITLYSPSLKMKLIKDILSLNSYKYYIHNTVNLSEEKILLIDNAHYRDSVAAYEKISKVIIENGTGDLNLIKNSKLDLESLYLVVQRRADNLRIDKIDLNAIKFLEDIVNKISLAFTQVNDTEGSLEEVSALLSSHNLESSDTLLCISGLYKQKHKKNIKNIAFICLLENNTLRGRMIKNTTNNHSERLKEIEQRRSRFTLLSQKIIEMKNGAEQIIALKEEK